MQRIVPVIWCNHTAEEAVRFYTSVFSDGRIVRTQCYPDSGLPDFQSDLAGEPVFIEFELAGFRFGAINAGPEFSINPSVSFMVNFDPATDQQAREHLDALWAALSEGGEALMPLQEYEFSPHYGWIQDKYGVSWQLMQVPEGQTGAPQIVPSLLFGDTNQGRAEEAITFYTEAFGGRVGTLIRYPDDAGASAGQVMFSDFELAGHWFAAMESPGHRFVFNPGVSLMVTCADQHELDSLWGQLSAVPEAEQCGWCTDQFGLSWQIVPDNLPALTAKPGGYQKLLGMKKIDIAAF